MIELIEDVERLHAALLRASVTHQIDSDTVMLANAIAARVERTWKKAKR